MESKKSVIVIGAGPAGLSTAHQLAKSGMQVTLIEAGPTVGGLARSFDLWGQRVDCGPHRFFSSDKIVNDYFSEIVKDDFTLVNRLTRIYYRNKFFFYPLQPLNALSNLPPFTVLHILVSYALQRLSPIKNPITLEEWVTNRFGYKLYSIFFKNYTEKLWGIPCTKIDADWAAQRIKKLSLFEAIKSALFGDKEQKHKTLVDQFAYPNDGTGMIYERIAEEFKKCGGILKLSSPVRRVVQTAEGKVTGVECVDGTMLNADNVISTMPLTQMVKGLQACPPSVQSACDSLYFRNTILVYVEVEAENLFPDNWIYVHSPDVLHGRITNFRNWCPQINRDKKTTILCCEYWCFDNDDIWKKSEQEMGELAKEELLKLKLIKPEHKVLNHYLLHIPKCYPVYEIGYMKNVSVIKNYLDTIPNLMVIGRYGSFKYNNQDHSILMGLLAARQLVSGRNEHLWNINTDSEYQEQGEVEYKN